MVLVDYSDSESDSELPSKLASTPATASKSAFQKAAPSRIKVELPSIKPEPEQASGESADGPPAKRARTGGAFSGFNSLLPAPKRTAQNTSKAGVGLKTSSEAAFSRNPLPKPSEASEYDEEAAATASLLENKRDAAPPEEPKLVGKPTRFLPLSVANKKKKKPIPKLLQEGSVAKSTVNGETGFAGKMGKASVGELAQEVEAVPKPKRSLFSMQLDDETTESVKQPNTLIYEPMMVERATPALPAQDDHSDSTRHLPSATNPNSLEATAAELNLTPAQRRQLFGRHGDKEASVMHFNLNNEYAANEQARQAGEVVEHRAVKAIAPGKHSLQQLVNNARSQQDAMEDKWAEGRRNRGEGGAKYGWSG